MGQLFEPTDNHPSGPSVPTGDRSLSPVDATQLVAVFTVVHARVHMVTGKRWGECVWLVGLRRCALIALPARR